MEQEHIDKLLELDKIVAVLNEKTDNLERRIETLEQPKDPDQVDRDLAKVYTKVEVLESSLNNWKRLGYILSGGFVSLSVWLLKIQLTK